TLFRSAKYQQAGVSFGRMNALMRGAPEDQLVAHGPVYAHGRLPEPPAVVRRPDDRLETLEVRGLTHRFDDSDRGIADAGFTLRRGTLTVVTGRIGSGKTTLLQTLLGLLPADAGAILWNGQPVDDP